jgi:hypothetical protein
MVDKRQLRRPIHMILTAIEERLKKKKIPEDPGPQKYAKDVETILETYKSDIMYMLIESNEKQDDLLEENSFKDFKYLNKKMLNFRSNI